MHAEPVDRFACLAPPGAKGRVIAQALLNGRPDAFGR